MENSDKVNVAESRKERKARNKSTFWADFKKFIAKGNIVDLAVAVVIGAAFGKIVTSLVNDIISPTVALITGGVSLAELKIFIAPAEYNELGEIVVPEAAIRYGAFLQSILDFIIIALAVFVAFRIIRRLSKRVKETADIGLKKLKTITAPGKPKEEAKPEQKEEIKAEEIKAEENKPAEAKAEVKDEPKKADVSNEKETSEEVLVQIRDLLRQNLQK